MLKKRLYNKQKSKLGVLKNKHFLKFIIEICRRIIKM
jgi:hypothetical protein